MSDKPRHLPATHTLLIGLGLLSLAMLAWGLLDGLLFLGSADDSAVREQVVVAQCGLGAVGAAASFGLAWVVAAMCDREGL
jgi:hypothetical protein